MHISIVLATCNGERYLSDQLNSYRSQTRLPDELIVCDDASSDQTMTILQHFAREAPFPIRIHPNDSRLGVTNNFAKAVSLAQGDVIAYSDQDDVWLPQKLQRIEQALLTNPTSGGVFMNAAVVDQHLRPLGYTLWDHVGFTQRLQQQVKNGHANQVFLKKEFAWGITLAFRSKLRDILLPFPQGRGHDIWTGLMVALHSGLILVSETLTYYRQHSQNTVGATENLMSQEMNRVIRDLKKGARKNTFAGSIEYYRAAKERLQQASGVAEREKVLNLLDQKICFLKRREMLPKRRILRLPICTLELFRLNYHRYSSGFYGMGKDLIERR